MSTLIHECDVLYVMFLELKVQAGQVDPWDADARVRWIGQCTDVLTAVPDDVQRWTWAYYLAHTLSARLPGQPFELVMGWLWKGHDGRSVR